MRRAILGMVAVLLLLAAPVFGADDVKELRKELAGLTRQIRTAEQKALRTDALKELKKAEMDAVKALQKAASEIPEIKEVDGKLAEARKQMMELTKQRRALEKKNAEALAEPNKTVSEAKAAVKAALAEVPGVKELLAKKAELEAKVKAAGGGRRKPPVRKPRKKKVPAGDAAGGGM